jgi:hypothetical protein
MKSMSPEKVSLLQRQRHNRSDENLHTGKLQPAVVCQRRFEVCWQVPLGLSLS